MKLSFKSNIGKAVKLSASTGTSVGGFWGGLLFAFGVAIVIAFAVLYCMGIGWLAISAAQYIEQFSHIEAVRQGTFSSGLSISLWAMATLGAILAIFECAGYVFTAWFVLWIITLIAI